MEDSVIVQRIRKAQREAILQINELLEKNDLEDDNIIYLAFQDEDGLLSNFKICSTMKEYREYQANHMANKCLYGVPLISGGFGHGKVACIPLFRVKNN